MGVFMVLPVVAIVLTASSIAEALIPGAVRKALGVLVLVIVVYTGFMGSIGAAIGGYLAVKQGARHVSTGSS